MIHGPAGSQPQGGSQQGAFTEASSPHVGHAAEGHAAEGHGRRFGGAQIPEQTFSHDDGTAPPALAHAVRNRDVPAVVAALQGGRLLVALVAQLDSATPEGAEKDSHMAAAMWRRPDGRVALMAFTSVAAMSQWDPQARPLPVPAAQAAQAALEDGADALLVDRSVALVGPALWAVAEGRVLVPPSQDADVRAVVETVCAQVLGGADLPQEVALVSGDDSSLTVLVAPEVAGDRQTVGELASRLAAEPVLRARVTGMQIGVAPVRPPVR